MHWYMCALGIFVHWDFFGYAEFLDLEFLDIFISVYSHQ